VKRATTDALRPWGRTTVGRRAAVRATTRVKIKRWWGMFCSPHVDGLGMDWASGSWRQVGSMPTGVVGVLRRQVGSARKGKLQALGRVARATIGGARSLRRCSPAMRSSRRLAMARWRDPPGGDTRMWGPGERVRERE
jgi:hypothetical protein